MDNITEITEQRDKVNKILKGLIEVRDEYNLTDKEIGYVEELKDALDRRIDELT